MILPEAARLRSLPSELWTALGRRFRAIGFTAAAAMPFARLATLAPDPRHASMAKWHLRRIHEPHARAMRMLMFWDPVTEGEARSVLGDELPLERLVEAGLLVREGERVVSAFVLQLLADLYVVSDDLRAGGEAVMGAAPSTKSLAALARPRVHAGRALDLGCGAGTLALAMAQKCDRVVATDVSERAVALARINVALNGLTNVDCRVGDLFATVEGESFDLVAAQPPYIPRDESAGPTRFLFGGPRGDELSMRILRELAPHVAPGGIAFLMAEWPVVEGDAPLDERIREALGARGFSTLFLQSGGGDIDEHCARYASIAHARLDDEYERASMRRRDHFERMRIRALQPMVAVVRRDGPELAWTSIVETRGSPMSRARVDAMFGARDLVARGPAALLPARLRAPEKIALPDSEILAAVVACDSVDAAIARLCAATGRHAAETAPEVLACVVEALLAGQLESTDG